MVCIGGGHSPFYEMSAMVLLSHFYLILPEANPNASLTCLNPGK